MHISQLVGIGNYGKANKFPPLDLSFVKNAIIQADWFLVERGLLGEITETGSRSGIYIQLQDLEQMNTYIKGFNDTFNQSEKAVMDNELKPWSKGRGAYNANLPFLEGVIKQCDKFLTEKTA